MKIKKFKCMVEVWDESSNWWDEFNITLDDFIAITKVGCKLELSGSHSYINVEVNNGRDFVITDLEIELEDEEKENE